MKQKLLIRPSAVVLTIALASMGLYACGQNSQTATNTQGATTDASAPALPLTTGAATAPIYAPAVTALPSAPRPKIVRVASQADEYAYVDQASSMGAALGNAPPDYGFDYDGVHPWVWRTHGDATRLIEPISGGYRYYYFQPGASEPYLIRDPQYSYGFNDGQLVVVYDARGQILPPQDMDQQADYAGRYLARARALYNASLQSQRRSVIAANWAARRAEIDAQQAEWDRQQSQYAAWQQYHQEHEAEQHAYWQGERDQRAASAAQFNQWHDNDYQGPPPPPAHAAIAGAAGAALVGGAIGGYLAGRDHRHDDRGPPPPQGGPGGPQHPDQAADIARAHQQQAQADASHQAQLDQQAKAAATTREQAMAQGRSQQAAADAARQAEVQRQSAAAAEGRRQQAQADAHAQEQAHAQAAAQAHQQQAQEAGRAQAQAAAQQAHQQQAAAQHQAQEAAHAQAAQAHQQQAAQAAAQHQAAAAAAHPTHPEGAHPPGEHPRRPGEGPPPAQN